LIEERIDAVFDEVGGLIGRLGQGVLELPDRRLARLASSVLSFKYTSISHIMVLDKPEITWDNEEANRFYLTMAELFELTPRYQEIKHKSETLMDVTDVFPPSPTPAGSPSGVDHHYPDRIRDNHGATGQVLATLTGF